MSRLYSVILLVLLFAREAQPFHVAQPTVSTNSDTDATNAGGSEISNVPVKLDTSIPPVLQTADYPLCPFNQRPPARANVTFSRCLDTAEWSCCDDCMDMLGALKAVSADESTVLEFLLPSVLKTARGAAVRVSSPRSIICAKEGSQYLLPAPDRLASSVPGGSVQHAWSDVQGSGPGSATEAATERIPRLPVSLALPIATLSTPTPPTLPPPLSCANLLSLAPTAHAWQVLLRLWSRVLGAQPGQRVQAGSKERSAAGGGAGERGRRGRGAGEAGQGSGGGSAGERGRRGMGAGEAGQGSGAGGAGERARWGGVRERGCRDPPIPRSILIPCCSFTSYPPPLLRSFVPPVVLLFLSLPPFLHLSHTLSLTTLFPLSVARPPSLPSSRSPFLPFSHFFHPPSIQTPSSFHLPLSYSLPHSNPVCQFHPFTIPIVPGHTLSSLLRPSLYPSFPLHFLPSTLPLIPMSSHPPFLSSARHPPLLRPNIVSSYFPSFNHLFLSSQPSLSSLTSSTSSPPLLPLRLPFHISAVQIVASAPGFQESFCPLLFPSLQSFAPLHPIPSLPSNERAHSPPVTHSHTLPSTYKSFSASIAYAFISPSLISAFLTSPSLISAFLTNPSLISAFLISPSLISPCHPISNSSPYPSSRNPSTSKAIIFSFPPLPAPFLHVSHLPYLTSISPTQPPSLLSPCHPFSSPPSSPASLHPLPSASPPSVLPTSLPPIITCCLPSFLHSSLPPFLPSSFASCHSFACLLPLYFSHVTSDFLVCVWTGLLCIGL
ncbi:unnamed protein product [Closterium sp. Yama58-4]|nr:unnamed protein product [Closterium sp. Yama58-4]